MKIQAANNSPSAPLLKINLPGGKEFELHLDQLSERAKKELSKIEDSAAKVEAIFVKDLLQKLTPKGAFGTGPMAGLIQDQFHQGMADSVGKNGSFGLAKLLSSNLRDALLRQEAATILLQQKDQTA